MRGERGGETETGCKACGAPPEYGEGRPLCTNCEEWTVGVWNREDVSLNVRWASVVGADFLSTEVPF